MPYPVARPENGTVSQTGRSKPLLRATVHRPVSQRMADPKTDVMASIRTHNARADAERMSQDEPVAGSATPMGPRTGSVVPSGQQKEQSSTTEEEELPGVLATLTARRDKLLYQKQIREMQEQIQELEAEMAADRSTLPSSEYDDTDGTHKSDEVTTQPKSDVQPANNQLTPPIQTTGQV